MAGIGIVMGRGGVRASGASGPFFCGFTKVVILFVSLSPSHAHTRGQIVLPQATRNFYVDGHKPKPH